MAKSEDSAFLDDIARMLEASELSVDLPVASPQPVPLADDSALSFLNDEPDEATTVSPNEPLDGASERQATPPPSRSTASRMRQREELEYLRSQVRCLEERLVELQRTKRSGSLALSHDDSHSDAKPIKSELPETTVLWERIAKRQLSAKQKAEIENAKLREMLQGQLKIARGLERVLRKRSTLEGGRGVVDDTKRRKRTNSTDEAMYEQLQLGVDQRHRELSAAFKENGLASNRSDLEDVRVLSTGDASQLSVEILYAKVLPFGFATTSAAVWDCTSSNYIQLPLGFYTANLASTDVIKAKFEIPMTIRRQSVKTTVIAVIKRYRESPTRDAYAWQSVSVLSSPYKPYDGIRLTDHGWTVVEALGQRGDPADPVTIVQSCSRIVPDETSLPRQSPIGILHDVFIASYNRNYATFYETLESALLRESTTNPELSDGTAVGEWRAGWMRAVLVSRPPLPWRSQTMAAPDDDAFLHDIGQLLDVTDFTAMPLAPDVDDATLFGTDLSLLDADDVGPTPRIPSRHGETTAAPVSRSTLCRKRQRDELEQLRCHVRELEGRLAHVERVHRRIHDTTSGPGRDSNAETIPRAVLWRNIAMHQLCAKRKAEAENARLREVIQDQGKVARSLARLLRKQPRHEVDRERWKRDRQAADSGFFQQLQTCLDQRYHELPAAFLENGLATARLDLEDARVLSSRDASPLILEMLHSKVLPFDFARLSEAVWTTSSAHYHRLAEGFYEAVSVSNDDVTGTFEVTYSAGGRHNITLAVRSAMRRYHESKTREVYAWESQTTVWSPHKKYDGLRLRDHGWTVVESIEPPEATGPTTIVRTCLHVETDGPSLMSQGDVTALSDVLIATYNRTHALLFETVESHALVRDSACQIR